MPAASKTLASASVAVIAILALASAASGGRAGASDSRPHDAQAPSAPANLRVTSATLTTVEVAWDRSTDNVGVKGYYVRVNGTRHAVSGTTFKARRLTCGASVVVAVRGYDRAGNRSPGTIVTVPTAACPDNRPPTAPTRLRQAATAQDAVVLEWDAARDNVGVVAYGVYDGALLVSSSIEPTVTLDELDCGTTYAYAVDAVDAAGNRSVRSSVWVTTTDCADENPPSAPTGLAVTDSTRSSLSLAWSASSDNVGVVGYRVSAERNAVDSLGYETGRILVLVTEPSQARATLSGLACGARYSLAVEAYDAARNTSPPAEMNAATERCTQPPTPMPPPPPPASPGDTTPPSKPSGLSVVASTPQGVSISWAPSSDDVRVEGYEIYMNGVSLRTVNQPGAIIPGLACGTVYTFEVDAYDTAGNHSPRASVTVSTSACVDAQPPTVPANVAVVSRTATSIALSWSESRDNVGVTGYGLYQGGSRIATTTGATGIFHGLTCNTNYTLSVDAFDASGNRSQRATVLVATTACSDTTPPSIPTGVAASNVTQTSLTLTWIAATDNVGVVAYDVVRNGAKVSAGTTTTSSQTGLACGTSYAFGIAARDGAGNTSAVAALNAGTAACSAPTAPTTNAFYVDPNGSDSGDGSQSRPWRTIAKACVSTPAGAGNTIIVNAGSYTESVTCNLPCKTNLRGAGGRDGRTTVRGSADPLISLQNCADSANAQSVSAIRLDGQNKTAGTRGMSVVNVRGLTITDLQSESFKGTGSGGGALNLERVWNANVSHSVFRNSGALLSDYATGTLGIGTASDSVFHDLTIHDATAYGVKGASDGGLLQNVEFYNLDCTVGSAKVLQWPAIAFELWQMDAVNVTIRDSRFNATMSLADYNSGSPLANGRRYNIHNNHFQIPPATPADSQAQYALELDQHSSEIHHNFFDGGVHPISYFTSDIKRGNSVHHNVFDNQQNWVALMRFRSGLFDFEFYENTVVLRQSWWTALFKVDELTTTSSPVIRDNIFMSTTPLGDVLGPNLGSATVDGNVFYNVAKRGTNAVVAGSQPIPLAGGFPNAYVPAAGSSPASLGALADGAWSVGPG